MMILSLGMILLVGDITPTRRILSNFAEPPYLNSEPTFFENSASPRKMAIHTCSADWCPVAIVKSKYCYDVLWQPK